MKKISLLAVSFIMGHGLTSLDKSFVKKSTDNDDNHFQSLCPSLRSAKNYGATNLENHQNIEGILKIDRDDNTLANDCLLNVKSDCTGSICKFREFTKNYFPEVL
jgi:hypothetical protein